MKISYFECKQDRITGHTEIKNQGLATAWSSNTLATVWSSNTLATAWSSNILATAWSINILATAWSGNILATAWSSDTLSLTNANHFKFVYPKCVLKRYIYKIVAKDTDLETFFSNPLFLCNMDTSASFQRCTSLVYKIHGI